jgi:hypothetical protein
MALVNATVGRVVDLLLYPCLRLPPLLGLAILSLATGLVMLVVLHRTSDDRRIAGLKRSMYAALLEIRLFNSDLRAMLRAQGEILRLNLTYLRLSLKPALWMAIPLAVLMIQLHAYYGYTGLRVGSAALVKVRLAASSGPIPDLKLNAPSGVRVETPTIWIPGSNEAVWRIVPDQEGDYQMSVGFGEQSVTKSLRVTNAVARRSPVRSNGGLFDQLVYPSEAPLPDNSGMISVSVAYPTAMFRVLGWDVHWTVLYLAPLFVLALGREWFWAPRNRR